MQTNSPASGKDSPSPATLTDSFGRRVDYVRLSVTDRCDLRCRYCMPERMTFQPRSDLLTTGEIATLADFLVQQGVRKLRLTGGEPLARKDFPELLMRIAPLLDRGLDELTLTTNGTQLARHARSLRKAGIVRINVSLDTLDRQTYAHLTRRDRFLQVLGGIAIAAAEGLSIKINTVALKGVNEADIAGIMRWAHAMGHEMSLIEVMPVGEVEEHRADQFVPLTAIVEELERGYTLHPLAKTTGGPARYYRVEETGGTLGLISPLTRNFCSGCNRLRITASGTLYPCLGGGLALDLRSALRSADPVAAIERTLGTALERKPEKHAFAIEKNSEAKVKRHMSVTGG